MSRTAVQFLVAGGLAALSVLAAWRWRLGVGRELLIAAVRAGVQLVAVGAIVALVFDLPELAVLFVGVMLAAATTVAAGRLAPPPRPYPAAATAVALPSLAVLGVLIATGAFAAEPRAIVPGAGILIGGAMVATGLTGRRFREGLRDRGEEVEARLCLGDPAREALRPIAVGAIGTALVPVIDQTRSVGLVTLPGTFVGLVLGGAAPADAARVQLLILLALVAVQLAAARIAAELAVRACVLEGDRVAELD